MKTLLCCKTLAYSMKHENPSLSASKHGWLFSLVDHFILDSSIAGQESWFYISFEIEANP